MKLLRQRYFVMDENPAKVVNGDTPQGSVNPVLYGTQSRCPSVSLYHGSFHAENRSEVSDMGVRSTTTSVSGGGRNRV